SASRTSFRLAMPYRLVVRLRAPVGGLALELAVQLRPRARPVLLGRAGVGALRDLVRALADHLVDHPAAARSARLGHDLRMPAGRSRKRLSRGAAPPRGARGR